MKYKNDDDNRYRVRFMRATEELMDAMTVSQFISYLEENAEFEDEDTMYLDGKIVDTKVYCLHETDKLFKEFAVTEDGRIFYLLSLIHKVELVDREEPEEDKEVVKGEKLTRSALRVGSVLKDLNGKEHTVIRFDRCFIITTYGKGENWLVEDHLEWETLVSY